MNGPETVPDRDYTTQQAADLCGMSINTLLSWQRRYGMPNPRRNTRGERAYTPEDIAKVRWLQAETARGVPIREAVRRYPGPGHPDRDDAPVEDVVVALDTTPMPPASTRPTSTTRPQRDLLAAVERFDRAGLSALLSRLALESDPATVAEHVVLPAVDTLARRVETGASDPAILLCGLHWLAIRLAHWLDALNPARQRGTPVAILVPEREGPGAIVALSHGLQLARQGTHVIDLPPNAPLEAFVAVARASAGVGSVLLFAADDRARRHAEGRAALLSDLLPAAVEVTVVAPGESPAPPQRMREDAAGTAPVAPD